MFGVINGGETSEATFQALVQATVDSYMSVYCVGIVRAFFIFHTNSQSGGFDLTLHSAPHYKWAPKFYHPQNLDLGDHAKIK